MTIDYAQEVFQPEQYRSLLVAFRPVKYIPDWYDGFGKTQPAVRAHFSPLTRGVWHKAQQLRKELPPKEYYLRKLLGAAEPDETLPVEKPESRLVTVKHIYLVEALTSYVGGSVIQAGLMMQIKTPWVLLPPEAGLYARIHEHCEELGWFDIEKPFEMTEDEEYEGDAAEDEKQPSRSSRASSWDSF
ncbi:hypothetical protein [Streptomyces subrutilus]|uniref:Uncharacterized protein n=1 Tax=Streptomyces subrutilus TaxID=36818 RepID=A0A1E5PXB1_9ACTN|nr:hypothetical protein [Streptomyces subrutilus]OEJ34165.1 hypothetical protein BGK67_25045 [Streptomyces subrutilus]